MKDYFGYNGKTVVVTGAASGMGKATTEMLVDLGAKVYALDWAEVTVEGIEKYIHTDLSKKESIDNAFDLIPEKIDSFFGIAGISGVKHDFLTTVIIDFVANKYICEEYLVDRMENGGSIAFMTSTAGNEWKEEGNKKYYMPLVEAKGWEGTVEAVKNSPLNILPGQLGYAFAKLAMNYMTISLMSVFGSKGVIVNSVLPGSTITGMYDEFETAAGGKDALLSYTGYAGRFAVSEEMATPIVFANSDMASYMAGELITVDWAHSAEIEAGIKENATPMNFDMLLQYFASMAQ